MEGGLKPTFFFTKRMNRPPDLESIRKLVEPVVTSLGLLLDDLLFFPQGKRWILRVIIDRTEGPVRLEDCEQVSRQVSYLLDVEDPIPHAYTLEVSSPGLDRPLRRPDDYLRFQGRRVRIQTARGVQEGLLLGLEEGRVRLQVRRGQIEEIPLEEIVQARLVVEFGR